MPFAFIRSIQRRWTLTVFHIFRLWVYAIRSFGAVAFRTRNAGVEENIAAPGNEPVGEGLGSESREFPSATEEQRKQARQAFIESIDLDAVCALAANFHGGRSCRVVGTESGSFNVCFFVAFSQDHPEWVVRIPIETALNDPWDKLQSEVSTLR
jgi:hypothetical protein